MTLWPLEIVSAKLTAVPPDIPAIDRYVPNGMPVCGALRLTLRTTGQMKIADLRGLDRLPLYLTGDERIASRLFELLHVSALATVIAAPGSLGARDTRLHAVTRNAVVHEGLTSSECLLPSNGERFQSHNLLLEYFACPSRFYFFTLTGLAPGLQQIEGREAEVIVLLRASTTELADRVDASQFALFCTPVINLFPLEIDAVELPASGAREVHLKPVGARSQDYELFSVAALHGHLEAQSERFEFMPLYSSFINDENNHGRHYTIRRERRLMPPSSRRYGTRAPYISTEVFVSIVDGDEMPYSQPMNYLSAQVLTTNRDLPNLLDCNGRDDLALRRSSPVATVGLVRAPSLPRPPCADGDVAWQLIRQMNFTYLSLENLPGRPSGEGLRQMLRLFPASDDVRHRQQIESITGVRTEPVTRRLPGNGELVFGRGIACYLDIDETGFDGISPYLFGLVLDHYLARHVSIHSFTQTELRSAQRGMVVRGPVRMGTRGAV